MTKHHGNVPHTQVAERYLKYTAAIYVHNHYCLGSVALEDIWHTKNPLQCQLEGILGFCFTNSYLVMKHFCDPKMQPHIFKKAAPHILITYKTTSMIETWMLNQSTNGSNGHTLEKLPNSRRCYMCHHGYLNRKTSNNSTLFKCAPCGGENWNPLFLSRTEFQTYLVRKSAIWAGIQRFKSGPKIHLNWCTKYHNNFFNIILAHRITPG